MMNEFHVIQAGARHLPLIAPLFDRYRQFYRQPPDMEIARGFIRDRLDHGESVIFLAVDSEGAGAEALGFTQLYPTFSSVAARRIWVLNDLYVEESARRRGVGRALLERAHRFARDNGGRYVQLATAIDNTGAQALYESLGYVRDTRFYHYFLDLGTGSG